MGTGTADHGFSRRKGDPASAQSVDTPVDGADLDDADADNVVPEDTAVEDTAVENTVVEGTAVEDDAREDGVVDDSAAPVDSDAFDMALESDAAYPDQTTTVVPSTPPARRARSDSPAPRPRSRRNYDSRDLHTEPAPHRRRRTDSYYDQDYRRRPPRGRAGWITASIIFFLLFGSAAALDWYLWETTAAWEQRASELTDVNYDLGSRLSAEQQTTMQLNSEIDLLTQQLATSNQMVTELSAEKAGAVDESAQYLQEIDGLNETVDDASGVANQLHACVDAQQEMFEYLNDAESYEPEDLEDFRTSVRELCALAEDANTRLQGALSQ